MKLFEGSFLNQSQIIKMHFKLDEEIVRAVSLRRFFYKKSSLKFKQQNISFLIFFYVTFIGIQSGRCSTARIAITRKCVCQANLLMRCRVFKHFVKKYFYYIFYCIQVWLVRLGQVRLGQVLCQVLCQVRLGQVRLGQVRLGVMLCYVRLGYVRFGQVRLGHEHVRQIKNETFYFFVELLQFEQLNPTLQSRLRLCEKVVTRL